MSFVPSIFISSLLRENTENISQQLQLWDSSALGTILKNKSINGILTITSWTKDKSQKIPKNDYEISDKIVKANAWLESHLLSTIDKKAPDFFKALDDTVAFRASKLCHFMRVIGKDIETDLSVVQLHEVGNELEQEAIDILKADKDSDFTGNTTADLTKHVVEKIINDLIERYHNLPENDQNHLVEQLTRSFDELDADAKERLQKEFQTEQITEEIVRNAIKTGGIASSIAALVGVSGFAAYTTITTILSVVSFGLLPFSAYLFATSFLAFITNPYILFVGLAGGAGWLSNKANKKIYRNMLPVFIALTVLSSQDRDRLYDDEIEMVEYINGLLDTQSEPSIKTKIVRKAFPCLKKPAEATKWNSRIFSLRH